jgi:hypothetical protein
MKKKLPVLAPTPAVVTATVATSVSKPNTSTTNSNKNKKHSKNSDKHEILFATMPANHILLQMNASTEEFPVSGGPAMGEFVVTAPVLPSSQPIESNNNRAKATRKRKQANNGQSNAKKRRITGLKGTIASPAWDSEATDTEPELARLAKNRTARHSRRLSHQMEIPRSSALLPSATTTSFNQKIQLVG